MKHYQISRIANRLVLREFEVVRNNSCGETQVKDAIGVTRWVSDDAISTKEQAIARFTASINNNIATSRETIKISHTRINQYKRDLEQLRAMQ